MSDPMVYAILPLSRPHSAGLRKEREAVTAAYPPFTGPLAGLWRGERDEAGRGPLDTPKVLFMSMLNLTVIGHSPAHTGPT